MFVPRLNSLFSERDVENAIIMAVRRLGYSEPTSEQSQAFLRGKDVLVCLYTRRNWKSLCYASLLRELANIYAWIACAYIRNTYCAYNFHILHVTLDLQNPPTQPRKPIECHQTPSLRVRGVGSGDETNKLYAPNTYALVS